MAALRSPSVLHLARRVSSPCVLQQQSSTFSAATACPPPPAAAAAVAAAGVASFPSRRVASFSLAKFLLPLAFLGLLFFAQTASAQLIAKADEADVAKLENLLNQAVPSAEIEVAPKTFSNTLNFFGTPLNTKEQEGGSGNSDSDSNSGSGSGSGSDETFAFANGFLPAEDGSGGSGSGSGSGEEAAALPEPTEPSLAVVVLTAGSNSKARRSLDLLSTTEEEEEASGSGSGSGSGDDVLTYANGVSFGHASDGSGSGDDQSGSGSGDDISFFNGFNGDHSAEEDASGSGSGSGSGDSDIIFNNAATPQDLSSGSGSGSGEGSGDTIVFNNAATPDDSSSGSGSGSGEGSGDVYPTVIAVTEVPRTRTRVYVPTKKPWLEELLAGLTTPEWHTTEHHTTQAPTASTEQAFSSTPLPYATSGSAGPDASNAVPVDEYQPTEEPYGDGGEENVDEHEGPTSTTTTATPTTGPAAFCDCPLEFTPVCGVDGVVYGSPCVAVCHGIAVYRLGLCGGSNPTTSTTTRRPGTTTKVPVTSTIGVATVKSAANGPAPQLERVELDVDRALLTLTFSAAILGSSLVPQHVLIHGLGGTVRLTSASLLSASPEVVAAVLLLSPADMYSLKAMHIVQTPAVSVAVESGVATDPAGRPVPASGMLTVSAWAADVTSPTLVAVTGSSTDDTVTLSFSEPMDLLRTNPALFAANSPEGTCTLQGAEVSSLSASILVLTVPPSHACVRVLSGPIQVAAADGAAYDLAGNPLRDILFSHASEGPATTAAPSSGNSSNSVIMGSLLAVGGLATLVTLIAVRRRTLATRKAAQRKIDLAWDPQDLPV